MSGDRQWVVDLENHGIDGSNKLRQILTNCSDPIATIKEFQEKNGLKLETLKPAMKLLDLHGIRRAEFHEMVLSDLTERTLAKIRELGHEGTKESVQKLEQQLEKSFKLYRVPKIRPIVLETLQQLPKVPDRYLKIIVADKSLYDCCAVSVRQLIWLKNDVLYLEAIVPLIDSYVAAKQSILRNVDQSATNFFTCETTKARRQWPQVQNLLNMIGERDQLYTHLLSVIRERFIKESDPIYCSLRMELIMAAHDLNIDCFVRLDPCHDFAWCLDACVRDKHLDAQQTNKLKNILDSTKKASSEMMGDIAMIAADPHVVHFLSSMAVKVLRDTATHCTGHLPRELVPLHLLLRLLSLGSSAHDVLMGKDTAAAQTVDAVVFTKFLSLMMTFIVEDIIRTELSRAPDEFIDENPVQDYLSQPSETVMNFLKTNVPCCLIWIHYILELFPSKRRLCDLPGALRYLRVLPKLKEKLAYSDPWIHLIVHRLVHSNPFESLVANEEFNTCFFDEFLMEGIEAYPAVKYHVLRMINLLSSSFSEYRLRTLVEKAAPEKIYEPGSLEDRSDMNIYTAEYNRVTTKLLDKGVTTDSNSANVASALSPVSAFQSLESEQSTCDASSPI